MPANLNTTAPVPAALAEALAGIRTDFVDGLVPLLNEMEYQQSALADPGQVPQALESIQWIAHKISGLAGSIGFDQLGHLAAELDLGVSQLRRGPFSHVAIDALSARLEDFMDLMEAALDAEF